MSLFGSLVKSATGLRKATMVEFGFQDLEKVSSRATHGCYGSQKINSCSLSSCRVVTKSHFLSSLFSPRMIHQLLAL